MWLILAVSMGIGFYMYGLPGIILGLVAGVAIYMVTVMLSI